jgi:hypothetical protein
MLREIDLAVPITITHTKEKVKEVTFRKGDEGNVCIITTLVPNEDGTTRLKSIRCPIANILTVAQATGRLDKVVAEIVAQRAV